MFDKSSRAKSKQFSNFLPAFRFLRPYKWRILLAGIALITTAGVSLSLGQGVRLLIDKGFVARSSEALTQTLLLFLVLITLLALGTFLRFYLVSWLGERVSADLRKAVFQHLLQLHPGFFETNLSGEIQARITADTTVLQTVIGSSLSVALRNVLLFLGGIAWLFWTNPKLTSIVLIAAPLLVSPVVIFSRRVRRLSRTSQDKVASVGAYVGEALEHIKIVQGMNHQQVDEKSFSQHVESAFVAGIQRIQQRAFLIAIVMLLVLGSIGGMLWVGGQDVLVGRMTPGELAAFVFYALIVASSLGFLSEVIGDLQRAAGATERLMELLEAESEITDPIYPKSLPSLVRGSVEINDLHFCYPSRPDSLALQAVNLHIEPGMTMALVGPSGAGKSTLLELLLRFYDPFQGSIRFEGIDLRSLALQELRQHIAFVPQQPTLFSANVWENLRYGKPDASKQRMLAATRNANAGDFLNKLPQGFDSFLGEQGVRLSGGQLQRLAIARAILRDPKLLLLDEATSALDAESERMVQEALLRLMQGRTTIVIAHRLSTVIHADQIAMMNNGSVIALGTHQQLLRTSQLYNRLAELQFQQDQAA